MSKQAALHAAGDNKRVLVIGDWVVDDYWVLVNHRSSKSSRTGLMHHRAVHKKDARIRAFCGAGQTAVILHNNNHDVLGLGLWSIGDDDDLMALFHPAFTRNPHSMAKKIDVTLPKHITLKNLGDYIYDSNANIGTTRVIRTYLKVGQQVSQLQRIDWELQAPSVRGDSVWKIDGDQLSKYFTPEVVDGIHGVVIKDLGKGVINDSIIKILLDKFPKVPWFVSTKSWKPKWLTDNLPRMPLKMLIIPQVAAQTAIEKGDVNIWIADKKYASQKALKVLKELHARTKPGAGPIIIVLPEKLSALALDFRAEKEKYRMGVIFEDNTSKLPLETNMASVFLGAAVVQLLNGSTDVDLKQLVTRLLNYTYIWQKHELKRIVFPDSWDPQKTPKVVLLSDKDKDSALELLLNDLPFNINHAIKEWDDALAVKSRGIVTDIKGKPKFQLWRAMVDVDGYVCITDSKQKNVSTLVHGIKSYAKAFMNSRGDRILQTRVPQSSCLLYAKPGAGKTSLVRKLAVNNNLRFIPYNITQMNRHIDILDCFDTIVTSSLQDPSVPLLIFIDEINAQLEREDVYKVFLTPMEDGVYIRGGKTYKLPPSFWVFASTITEDDIKIRVDGKGSDFCSRLTYGMVSLDLPAHSTPDEQLKKLLENIYFSVATIMQVFPDVREISQTVFDMLADHLIEARMRPIRHFIENFRSVQYGQITIGNIPYYDKDRISITKTDIDRYQGIEDRNLVMVPIL